MQTIPQRGLKKTGLLRVRRYLDGVIARGLTPLSVTVAGIGVILFVTLGPLQPVVFANGAEPVPEAVTGAGDELPGVVGSGAEVMAVVDSRLERRPVPYTIIPDRPRDHVISYTVVPGDTIGDIALRFGLDRNTIYWGNVDVLAENLNMLWVGMTLNIMPVDGVYHKADGVMTLQQIADKYQVDVWDIIESEYNELEGYAPEDVPVWGMRIVVPGGTGPLPEWPSPIQMTVSPTGRVSYGFMSSMPGACGSVMVNNLGTGLWVKPVANYVRTEPFGGFHSGIDLAYTVGTPVYAADTGTVIFAGWNTWGYGNLVVLDHGNGWTSYYGHLSSWSVSCGQVVTRGQYIGAMGSTGNSTGPHLHYEMRWNHIPQNPSPFIGIW